DAGDRPSARRRGRPPGGDAPPGPETLTQHGLGLPSTQGQRWARSGSGASASTAAGRDPGRGVFIRKATTSAPARMIPAAQAPASAHPSTAARLATSGVVPCAARWPAVAAAAMVLSTAMPIEAPICCTVLTVAEATPE